MLIIITPGGCDKGHPERRPVPLSCKTKDSSPQLRAGRRGAAVDATGPSPPAADATPMENRCRLGRGEASSPGSPLSFLCE